jgi:ribosomal RNA-processing protein 8
MFAVPGWSLSSSNLKTQTLTPPNNTTNADPSSESHDPEAAKNSKKRNRSNGKSKALKVNSSTLADLWETVIEGRPKYKKPHSKALEKLSSGENTKRKKAHKGENEGDIPHKDGVPEDSVRPTEVKDESEPASKKRKTKEKKEQRREKDAPLKPSSKPPTTTPSTISTPKPTAQLTPLQISMRQKLVSARFRHLNQALYTTPSAQSMQLFQENPEMFQEYHEGFRRQVEVWPENPVDGYVAQIRARGAQRPGSSTSKHTPPNTHQPLYMTPLPRTEGTCRIADLGCGDAALAQGLQRELRKMKLQIHSFDLQSDSVLVTRADIAALPLAEGSVDVAIFCLALMGTNWVDFVEEAFRVLRWKGELWVAEIKSRFGRVGGGAGQKRVEHSVGKRVKKEDKKIVRKQEEEMDEKDLAVEVDGHEDTKQETDVSAFVEVLRKRGFVLQGDPDLQNKMFVRMRFVKGLTPIKGKGVPLPKGMQEVSGETTWQKKPPKGKFIDEDIPVSSEASVLKPCVYKLR